MSNQSNLRKKRTTHPTVTLTRTQIVWILEHAMGWEPIDTRSFWGLAKKETLDPGCLEQQHRNEITRMLAKHARKEAKAKTQSQRQHNQ